MPESARVAAVLGNFDGVHIGHQMLIRKMIGRCREWERSGERAASVIISFHPHPVTVLSGAEALPFISTQRQRVSWSAALGVDFFNLIHFTRKFGQCSAGEFVDRVLLGQIRIAYLAIGSDARVGKGGEGDASFLAARMKAAGAEVDVVPDVSIGGIRVSSGAVRNFIREARFAEAEAMLSRPFRFEGMARRGDGRGRTLGFPTVNTLPTGQILPPDGVYATQVSLRDGTLCRSVTNIGFRPTFNGRGLTVETHILDFEGEIPEGQRVEIDFHARLREEKRFKSVDELKEQIAVDTIRARGFFDGKR